MLEWSCLFVKKMILRAPFQTQTCFDSVEAAWMAKHFTFENIFCLYPFSLN